MLRCGDGYIIEPTEKAPVSDRQAGRQGVALQQLLSLCLEILAGIRGRQVWSQVIDLDLLAEVVVRCNVECPIRRSELCILPFALQGRDDLRHGPCSDLITRRYISSRLHPTGGCKTPEHR